MMGVAKEYYLMTVMLICLFTAATAKNIGNDLDNYKAKREECVNAYKILIKQKGWKFPLESFVIACNLDFPEPHSNQEKTSLVAENKVNGSTFSPSETTQVPTSTPNPGNTIINYEGEAEDDSHRSLYWALPVLSTLIILMIIGAVITIQKIKIKLQK